MADASEIPHDIQTMGSKPVPCQATDGASGHHVMRSTDAPAVAVQFLNIQKARGLAFQNGAVSEAADGALMAESFFLTAESSGCVVGVGDGVIDAVLPCARDLSELVLRIPCETGSAFIRIFDGGKGAVVVPEKPCASQGGCDERQAVVGIVEALAVGC